MGPHAEVEMKGIGVGFSEGGCILQSKRVGD
jgi:hypothetical protein